MIQPHTLFFGRHFIHLEVIDSTMSFASDLIAKSKPSEGTVVLADYQQAGRGQAGNTWQSSPAENLTLSAILYPSFLPVRRQFYLNMAVSLAVKELVETQTGIPAQVKWPNDILIAKKKVAGILISNTLRGDHLRSSIVGVGLNVNQTQFVPELNKATSLRLETGQYYDRKASLELLCEKLEQYYLLLRSENVQALKQAYLEALYGWQLTMNFHQPGGASFEAVITDVDESGKLCLRVGPEVRLYNFKELVFHLG